MPQSQSASASQAKKKPWPESILKERLTVFLLILLLITLGLFWIHSAVQGGPWGELASGASAALLIGFGYEVLVRKQWRDAVRDELIRTMLLEPEVVKGVLKKEHVDEIMRLGLEVRLGDPELAQQAYGSMVSQLDAFKERWSDYKCNITLTSITDPMQPDIAARWFDALLSTSFTSVLQKDKLWFTVVPTVEESDRIARDQTQEWDNWFIVPKTADFALDDDAAYSVVSAMVRAEHDDVELNLTRTTRSNRPAICASHPELSNLKGQTVEFIIKHRLKVTKRGHLLYATVVRPTNGVAFELDATRTDIRRLFVFGFLVSSVAPSIDRTPNSDRPTKVAVHLDQWVLPKSGVVFSWSLEGEYSPVFEQLMHRTQG